MVSRTVFRLPPNTCSRTLASAGRPGRTGRENGIGKPCRARIAAMKWIEANGVGLRYELAGSGNETVVLVHEMGGSLESWEGMLPALQKSFRTLRYDQRGFGQSEKPAGPLALGDMVSDI